jgi:hypothetical protein
MWLLVLRARLHELLPVFGSLGNLGRLEVRERKVSGPGNTRPGGFGVESQPIFTDSISNRPVGELLKIENAGCFRYQELLVAINRPV